VPSVAAIVRIGTDAELQPAPNAPPTAAFSASCSLLSCLFTDHSTDSDGAVTAWSWSFGDGGSSTLRSPSHAFATAGSYPITLTATDDLGASQQASGSVTVSQAISLSASGRSDATTQYMTLTWTGATGARVDIWRNGKLLVNTLNDGKHVNTRTFTGAATYVYKVCETATTTCSNEATVAFK